MADMVPIESSNIAGASYDDDARELHVMFNSGSEYAYDGVPRAIYEELLSAPSAGQFFNRAIKPAYPARRIS